MLGTMQAFKKWSVAAPFQVRWPKALLWLVLGAMVLSVTIYSEIPLARKPDEQAYMRTIPLLIIPHFLGGLLALLSGPLLFSSRLRGRYPKFHRVLGRVYVLSVLIAAPLGVLLSNHRHDPRAIHFVIATIVQATTWGITTLAALFTARNGYFQQHREWMVRSYAVTFTFITTRVLQPLPIWNRQSVATFSIKIIIITFLSVLVPDIAFHWRQLTSKRTARQSNSHREREQLSTASDLVAS